MRSFPVEFRPKAIQDLDDIFDRVLQASQNPVVAEGYVRRIRARCDRIGNVPYGGRPRSDLVPGLRMVPFEKRAVVAYYDSRRRRLDYQYLLRWTRLRNLVS